MLRLILLAAAFGGGLFAGLSLQQSALDGLYRDAGGRVGPSGICEGVPASD